MQKGYYLKDDTCIPCSESLESGHYCPKGTNTEKVKYVLEVIIENNIHLQKNV